MDFVDNMNFGTEATRLEKGNHFYWSWCTTRLCLTRGHDRHQSLGKVQQDSCHGLDLCFWFEAFWCHRNSLAEAAYGRLTYHCLIHYDIYQSEHCIIDQLQFTQYIVYTIISIYFTNYPFTQIYPSDVPASLRSSHRCDPLSRGGTRICRGMWTYVPDIVKNET